MGIFLTAVLSSISAFLAVSQIIRNHYGPEPHEENAGMIPFILIVLILCLLCNLVPDSRPDERMPLLVSMALAGISPLSCSVVPPGWYRNLAYVVSGLLVLSVIAFILCLTIFNVGISVEVVSGMSVAFLLVPSVIFGLGIYHRIRDIKVVMRVGSVWSMLCVCVDAVYVVIILIYALLLPVVRTWVSVVLLFSVLVALCVRIRNHSVFVFMASHERRIVESMRLSQIESTGESRGTEMMYNNIYERLLRYFETKRPYLDNGLTINDVVAVMYTNKLYISRAISHCSGRNFCQFVNYHRVSYAVELFRVNPQLKVIELANQSGFNSTTSFNNAFRLYMGEKPSDWCRKERGRMHKK